MKQISVQKTGDGCHYLLFRREEGFGLLPNSEEQLQEGLKLLDGLFVAPNYESYMREFAKLPKNKLETAKQLSFTDLL